MNEWDRVASSFHGVSSKSIAHNRKYSTIADEILNGGCLSVLDLGCGSGLLEQALFRKGFRGKVLAIDGSQKMLSIAKKLNKNYLKNVTFENKFIDEAFRIIGYYDCVVIMNLLYLVSDKSLIIKKVHDSLLKKGKILLVDPKPTGNLVEMIAENMSGRGAFEIAFYLLKNILLLAQALKFAFLQRRLDARHVKKEMLYLELSELKEILKQNSFIIEKEGSIQANQNWYIIGRRV